MQVTTVADTCPGVTLVAVSLRDSEYRDGVTASVSERLTYTGKQRPLCLIDMDCPSDMNSVDVPRTLLSALRGCSARASLLKCRVSAILTGHSVDDSLADMIWHAVCKC